MRTSRDFDLRGKDYFTVDEAAHFSCVCNSQFRAKAKEYGIQPFPWMGKQVYRRIDLVRAMERAHELSMESDPAPDSPSVQRTGFEILAAVAARKARRAAREKGRTDR